MTNPSFFSKAPNSVVNIFYTKFSGIKYFTKPTWFGTYTPTEFGDKKRTLCYNYIVEYIVRRSHV